MLSAELIQEISVPVGGIDAGSLRSVGGGSINRSYRVRAHDGSALFLKTNDASAADMFEAEREGLLELERADAVRVPKVIVSGVAGDTCFLLMEYLELARPSRFAGATLGAALAHQHQFTDSRFGWARDNTIGSTKQCNTWHDDWISFYRDERLGFQLDLAEGNGFDTVNGQSIRVRGEALLQRLPDFFIGYEPVPSLLHGDLWGGNWGAIDGDKPVIFDPAVYYGDREADIAMTRLFGGFGTEFYDAYNDAWRLDAGFERRCGLYNLYHLLNHLNLFGGGYLRQVSDMLDRLIA
jgi:protein-ribulosamine 3-kinase